MWSYKVGRTFLERLPHDSDLIRAIKDTFKASDIGMGTFMAIGAVKQASIGFYDQRDRAYRDELIDEPAEILACIGNVSELDGDISVHAHITLALQDGTVRGGHLLEGTTVYACELLGMGLEGEQLERVWDETTGLKLWNR
jgi:uncharacterized protein